MAEVIFNYEGNPYSIQCNVNDKIKDIKSKFLLKIVKNDTNLYYLYNGSQLKDELTFNEQANDLDKNRKKMNIIVTQSDEDKQENKKVISKDIICPECKENILIDIKNFKINLSGCKNNHERKNILLYNYEEIQKINLNEITCNICNKNNKNITHNNEFYICNTCNKNICPLCKSVHDKKHMIISYDDKNYICRKHKESFNKFCKTCNENICILCESKHKGHNIFELAEIIIDKNDLINTRKELKKAIDKFKYKIGIIKEIFDKMAYILDAYYKINDSIINNYDVSKRNYQKLQNLNYLKNNNEKLSKDLNNILDNDKISEIYDFSIDNFYNEYGEKYVGKMKYNFKCGKGILYFDKDDKYKRKKYEGSFHNDDFEGKGIMFWNDGNKYEGDWKNGQKEGKGILY